MKSKHLDGRAVDLMAYIDGRGSWELNVYDEVADAMAEACRELNVVVPLGRCMDYSKHCCMGRYNGRSYDELYRYS